MKKKKNIFFKVELPSYKNEVSWSGIISSILTTSSSAAEGPPSLLKKQLWQGDT